jgi:metal-sulfur cluster biosynthetic enzyme
MSEELNDNEQKAWQLLKGVIDPELMVNIADLGLVYDIRESIENKELDVDITLTSKGCPLGDVIMEDARAILQKNFEDYKITINLVWEPAWTTERLSEKGRELLGQ